MKVNVEEVKAIYERLDEINSVKLDDIEWYKGGKKIEIDADILRKYKWYGLPNSFFIRDGDYKDGVNRGY